MWNGLNVFLMLACAVAMGAGCYQQMVPAPSDPAVGSETAAPADIGGVDFASQVAPILAERCHECHGSDQPKAGLNLLSMESLLAGGKSGSPVVAGDADGSRIVQAIQGTHPDVKKMPPRGGPLSDDQIATIRAWISGM